MKLVNHKKPVNQDIVATLMVLLEEAKAGDIQCLAVIVGYSALDVVSVYCPSSEESPMDERIMLAEMQLMVTDTSLSLASQDASMFSSKVLTASNFECE
jgi:hypothetical protein